MMGQISKTVKVLIILNVIFYLGSHLIGKDASSYLFALWFIEHPYFQIWQPITSMFMHDMQSPMHLFFNMYALWAFGSAVEKYIGQNKFVFFYFSAGIGAALIHTLVNYYDFQTGMQLFYEGGMSVNQLEDILKETVTPGYGLTKTVIDASAQASFFSAYNVPAVGASGAIYGVLVAFGVLFPNAELMLLFVPFPIKAKYFIPGLLALDLFSGLTGFSLFGQNIANWAHIGGALFGFIMIYYWKKNSFDHTRLY